MELAKLEIHGVTVVRIAGRLDITGSEGLEKKLGNFLDTTKGNLLLNLRDVTYMSSSGISSILGASRAAKAANRKLALCEISSSIKKLLEVVELGNIFPVYEGEDDGIAALK
ncbi:MAG: STAS domain-containing protein [Leptospirales bacterium]|nr:STAS domain-containing protein [Leptospirales bacterium]